MERVAQRAGKRHAALDPASAQSRGYLAAQFGIAESSNAPPRRPVGQRVSRGRLVRDAAGPVFGFQTRLLDALHDSAHETRRRKLLQISGDPAFAFLDALHAAMVQKTGLDPDYVRLGAVLPVLDEDGNPTGSVSGLSGAG